MRKLPPAFTQVPKRLRCCNASAEPDELHEANAVRTEYLMPDCSSPWMVDVVRAFRVAQGAKVYIEVGTQDKGNIAWLARTKLAKGATIIDVDFLDYADNDARIRKELAAEFDYHWIRGDCLSDQVVNRVQDILGGRRADVIFCDSHYTYEHTLTEFTLYYPLLRVGGFLLFHDAEWPGDSSAEGEVGKKGKGLAIQQLDRFYPAYIVCDSDTPLYRPLPIVSRAGHWASLAIFSPD